MVAGGAMMMRFMIFSFCAGNSGASPLAFQPCKAGKLRRVRCGTVAGPKESGSSFLGFSELPVTSVPKRRTIWNGVIEAEAQYRDWMLAGLAGDAAAYRRLLAALSGHLRSYFARRVGPSAAEDLVQETLIAIHARRETYEPSLPLTAWVYGIARYKLIDEYRREKRKAPCRWTTPRAVRARRSVESAGARRDVEKLLAKLPAAKRALVRAIKLEASCGRDGGENRHVGKRGEGERAPVAESAGRKCGRRR